MTPFRIRERSSATPINFRSTQLSTAQKFRLRKILSASLLLGLLASAPVGTLAPAANAVTTVALSATDKLAFVKSTASFALSATQTQAGAGKAVGDIVVYKNVGSFGGVSIDCAVTTVAIASGSISVYDDPGSATTAGTYLENFQLNTIGGQATFKFEFFKAGTYTVPNSGTPVILQNVKITSIDLDSSGTNGFQYTDFTGFQKYSMMNPTNLGVQPLTSPNRVRFIATKTGARSSVPEDQVLVKYDAVQTIQMNFGNVVAGGTNYFGLVFGGWPGAGAPVEYTNVFNAPPVSTNLTRNIALNPTPSTLPLASFGDYSDPDNNPFTQIKVASFTGGSLEYSANGSTWNPVTTNQIITVADIDLGRVRFTPTDTSDGTVLFNVHDGLDYSVATNTLTLHPAGIAQTITFANPGTKAVTSGRFASGATASSGLTVVLTSLTPGICTVSGLDIVPVAAGTCVIVATQPGDSTHPAADPVTQSFPITGTVLTAQTLTLLLASPQNKGTSITPTAASATNKITSSAVSVNSLNVLTSLTPSVCTVATGTVITYNAAGICTIEANNPGDSTYGPATAVTASVTVEAPALVTQPIPTTLGAHSVNTTLATLTGMVDVNGAATTYRFCYSTSSTNLKATARGSVTSPTVCVATSSLTSSDDPLTILSTNLTGLNTRTTYYYNISAWNSSNVVQYGEVFKFATWSTSKSSRKRPMVQTNALAAQTSTTATLSGTGIADDVATATKISFCVSSSPAFSATTGAITCNISGEPLTKIVTAIAVSPGTTVTRVTNPVLVDSTLYYYQASITRTYNGADTIIYANIVPFRTSAKMQEVTTTDATALTTTSAVLNGSVQPHGVTTTTGFIYSTSPHINGSNMLDTSSPTAISASPATVSGESSISISASVTSGLVEGTRYYFQATGLRGGITVYGPVKSFILGSPSVKTLAPSNLNSTGSWNADLNGFVNPNGTNATISFCYKESATTPALDADGNLTGCTAVTLTSPSDTTTVTVSFSKNLASLTAGKTYYYQAVATNTASPSRVVYGELQNFTTAIPPTATTTSVPVTTTSTTASIAGTLTSNGAGTDGGFCVSASSALDDTSSLINCELGISDNEATFADIASASPLTGTLTGLQPLTTYWYQATAVNPVGTGLGAVYSFTTLPGAPIPVTLGATAVVSTAARLNGTVNPGGAVTTVKFNYGTYASAPTLDGNGKMVPPSGSLTTVTLGSTIPSDSSTVSVYYDITGLSGSNLYYFQIETTNSSGTSYGEMLTFSVSNPFATTDSSELITSTTARLNGTGTKSTATNPTAEICLSTSAALDVDGALGGCTSSAPVTMTNPTHALLFDVTGLAPGTVYYFQASATEVVGGTTNYGSVLTFTTLFQVLFDGNGSADTMTAISGSSTTALTINTMARTGYTFTGWNTAADGSGTPYADHANFAFTSNATMYAQWSVAGVSYVVTYDPNGGSVSPTTETFTGTALTLPTPTRAGYTFNGWYTLASGGTLIGAAGASYSPAGTITIYAQWSVVAPTPNVTITWITPNKINYPTALSTTQLNATVLCQGAAVTGTFTYSPELGSILKPGTYTLSVRFTPSSGACNGATTTTQLVVEAPSGATITWPTPATATGPLTLSSSQLNAVCSVPGTLTYDPALGTVLQPGTYTLRVTCTPTDTTYPPISTTVSIVVEKQTPKITWADPNAIIVGIALSVTQLNAIFSVPGVCVYTPALGTKLSIGIQTLSVTCTPTDANLYKAVTTTVKIDVQPVPIIVPVVTTGKVTFEVFYAMNSYFLDAKNRNVIDSQVAALKKKLGANAKISVSIVGWVQPTKISPNVEWLSSNRAKVVATYMKALGLKASYILKAPGHDKDNNPAARHATVEITWSSSK